MNNYLIPNLVKACEILSILAERPMGISATTLEHLVQVPRTTAFRVLKTLCAQGLAEKRKALFFAGPQLVKIGLQSLQSQEIRTISIPFLSDLATKTGLTAHLAVPNQWKSLILEVHDSPNPVRVASRPGTIVPLHCSSTGKVFLAFCYEDRIDEYFSQTAVTKLTDTTIVTPDVMKQEIDRIKTQGYAVDNHEFYDNVFCIAAPVRDSRGQVTSAIGVTGPSIQYSRSSVSDISQIVTQAANELSAVMGYRRVSIKGKDSNENNSLLK